MIITKPELSESISYYHPYIVKVTENDLIKALVNNESLFTEFIKTIPIEKADYGYTDEKWTIKEVLIHVCDAERIFAYRALRFARNDKTALAGFEENDYVPNSNALERTLHDILNEFVAVRQASITLFKSFNPEMMVSIGKANGTLISVRALGFIIAGHALHHQKVLLERYLK